jgi:hypothetical protein
MDSFLGEVGKDFVPFSVFCPAEFWIWLFFKPLLQRIFLISVLLFSPRSIDFLRQQPYVPWIFQSLTCRHCYNPCGVSLSIFLWFSLIIWWTLSFWEWFLLNIKSFIFFFSLLHGFSGSPCFLKMLVGEAWKMALLEISAIVALHTGNLKSKLISHLIIITV